MVDKDRVNEIDLLRFVAAFSVVLFHYSFRGYAADALSQMPYPALAPAAKYGYLGVELFFLISGFVIMMTASSGSLRDFAVSRAVRLFPAFWVCCSITFAVLAIADPDRSSVSVSQYLVNLTMLGGFVGVPPVDGVYWSLFVELQFYVLVALLLATHQIKRAERFLLLWLLAVLVLVAFFPPGKLHFVLVTNYAAYFIAGALAFFVRSRGPSPSRIAAFAAAWVLAVCQSLNDLPAFEEHYRTAMSGSLVAAGITSIFAIVLLVALRKTGALGRCHWLVLGALTYPLYLLHQNLGYLVFNATYPAFNAHVVLWTTVAMMLMAAFAVNRYVERRFSPHLKRALNRLLDLVAARFPGLRGTSLRPAKQRR